VPLRLSFASGALVGILSIESGVRSLLAHIFGWYTVSGWTSLTIRLNGIGAALLFSVGMLGEYVGKLYEQSKDRPLYFAAPQLQPRRRKPVCPAALWSVRAGRGATGLQPGAVKLVTSFADETTWPHHLSARRPHLAFVAHLWKPEKIGRDREHLVLPARK
jgi:hypothetical protein